MLRVVNCKGIKRMVLREMEKKRKIFRNPASDLLFVIGLVISCVILINVAELISKLTDEEKGTNRFKFVSDVSVEVGADVSFDDKYLIKDIIDYYDKVEEGNMYIYRTVHVDKQKDEQCAALVLMEDNENLQLKFKEGGYVKGYDYKNAAIIGESLEEYIIEEEGKKYISIDGERFSVIGILENNMSSGIDKSFYILWDTMETDIKTAWIEDEYYPMFVDFYYESNVQEPSFMEVLVNSLPQYQLQFEVLSDEHTIMDDWINEMYKNVKKILLSGTLIFSVLTCFSVSYLWLLNRRKELSVRMAYGYSAWQIFKLLFRDTLLLMLPALVISVVIQSVYNLLFNKELLSAELFWLRILVVFTGILCIVCINTLYLMRKLKGFSAVMINQEN